MRQRGVLKQTPVLPKGNQQFLDFKTDIECELMKIHLELQETKKEQNRLKLMKP